MHSFIEREEVMREKLIFYVSSHSLKEEMEKLKEGLKGDDKIMLGIPINLLKDAEVVEMSEDKTKKNEGEVTKKCKTPKLTEDDVKARFIKAYSSMFINKDEMISNIELVKARIIDTAEIDNKISKLNDELQGLAKDIETLVKENTKTLKDQEIWKKKYAELEYSYKTKAGVLNDLTLKKKEKSLKANRIEAFTSLLK